MIHYFLELLEQEKITTNSTTRLYSISAIIDDLYYWKTEWRWNASEQQATIQAFQAGFISKEDLAGYKLLTEVSFSELSNQFGSFAYFIERAVNGFKSYIMWIKPSPQTNTMPWKISAD